MAAVRISKLWSAKPHKNFLVVPLALLAFFLQIKLYVTWHLFHRSQRTQSVASNKCTSNVIKINVYSDKQEHRWSTHCDVCGSHDCEHYD